MILEGFLIISELYFYNLSSLNVPYSPLSSFSIEKKKAPSSLISLVRKNQAAAQKFEDVDQDDAHNVKDAQSEVGRHSGRCQRESVLRDD